MGFEHKIAVVTGGAKGIGKAIAQEFQKAGARACVIDLLPNDCFVGDLARREVLEDFARKVIADHGHVDYLINNALPLIKGIDTCTYEEFLYALQVGVAAPFYLPGQALRSPLCPGGGHCEHLLLPGPDESAPDRELYRRQGGHLRPDPRSGGEPGRPGAGQLHLPRLDRHQLHGL